MPRVVIVGAGFGGLAAAKELAGAPVEVVLVDRHNFHTFQPLLYQVATAGLNAADVAYAVRGIFQRQRNLSVRHATVTGVDWERRCLLVADGSPIPFDHLILAMGATANFFGVPGAAEHALPLYELTDAVRLRNHLLQCFEKADADPSMVDAGALTFLVVGGGPTGVEVAGAMVELIERVLRKDFPRLDVGRARVVLVELQDRLLAAFSPESQRHALEELQRRGVEVRFGEAVAEVRPDGVRLASGEEVPARTLVWAAGVRASRAADLLGLPQVGGGRLAVADDLRVPGFVDVYAVGDVAAAPGPGGRPQPQLAPVAMQAGRHAARQVERRLAGRSTVAFRYRNRGTMATIGRRAAVAELPLGVRLSGGLAWLAWLGLHVVMLMGMRNRLSVLLNWAWNYLTWDRGPRIIFEARDE